MRDCENRQESLKAYLDGELPIVQKCALVWHLVGCSVCREERDAMQRFSAQLKGEETPLSTNLRNRILNSVAYTEPLVASPKNTSRLTAYRTLAWTGGAVTLLFGALFVNKMLTVQPNPHMSDSIKTSSPMPTSAGSAASTFKGKMPLTPNLAQPQSGEATKSPRVILQNDGSSDARSPKDLTEDKTAMKPTAPGLIPKLENMSKMQGAAPNQARSSDQFASPGNSSGKILNGKSDEVADRNGQMPATSEGLAEPKSALGSSSSLGKNATPSSSSGRAPDNQGEFYSPQKAYTAAKKRASGEKSQQSANQHPPITANDTEKNVLIISRKRSPSVAKKKTPQHSFRVKKKDISKFHRKYRKRKPRKETIEKSFNRP